MRGLAAAVRGMKLVDTQKIQEQGRRAYHMGIPFNANPLNGQIERKSWEIGWNTAQARWTALLKRNEGCLGIRPSLASPSFA